MTVQKNFHIAMNRHLSHWAKPGTRKKRRSKTAPHRAPFKSSAILSRGDQKLVDSGHCGLCCSFRTGMKHFGKKGPKSKDECKNSAFFFTEIALSIFHCVFDHLRSENFVLMLAFGKLNRESDQSLQDYLTMKRTWDPPRFSFDTLQGRPLWLKYIGQRNGSTSLFPKKFLKI